MKHARRWRQAAFPTATPMPISWNATGVPGTSLTAISMVLPIASICLKFGTKIAAARGRGCGIEDSEPTAPRTRPHSRNAMLQ